MSRSHNQKHPTSHSGKTPRTVLEITDDGEIIYRKRKIKPYGRKDNYTDEQYKKKYGDYSGISTAKIKERKKNKISIYDDFDED